MNLDFLDQANWVNVVIDLIMIVITTGVTYFLFSSLPMKRRKKVIAKRMEHFNAEALSPFKKILSKIETNKKPEESAEPAFVLYATWYGKVNLHSAEGLTNAHNHIAAMADHLISQADPDKTIQLANSLALDDADYLNLSIALSDLVKSVDRMTELTSQNLSEDLRSLEHGYTSGMKLIHSLRVSSINYFFKELISIINASNDFLKVPRNQKED